MNDYLANNLIFLRKKKSLTQHEITEIVDISRSSYVNYELGKYTPDINILMKICNFYAVSIGDIIEKDMSNAVNALKEKNSVQVKNEEIVGNVNNRIPFVSRWNCLQYINLKKSNELNYENFPHFSFIGINSINAIAFEVCNNDMQPKFTLGDVVIGIKQPEPKTFQTNKLVALLLDNGELIIGWLTKIEDKHNHLHINFENTVIKPRIIKSATILTFCLIVAFFSFSIPSIEPSEIN